MTHRARAMRAMIVVTAAKLASGTEKVRKKVGHINLRRDEVMVVCGLTKIYIVLEIKKAKAT